MQAIPNRVESGFGAIAAWFAHTPYMPRYLMFGLILFAFFMGAAWQNGSATKEAVTSVQSQYQGKLEYHVQNEKVVAKAVAKALDACEHNLNAALNNDAGDVRGCPQPPPQIKAMVPQIRQ